MAANRMGNYFFGIYDALVGAHTHTTELAAQLTFFDVTIFLKSSRRISFSLPTVLRNSCSSRSNEPLSNPVRGLENGKFKFS